MPLPCAGWGCTCCCTWRIFLVADYLIRVSHFVCQNLPSLLFHRDPFPLVFGEQEGVGEFSVSGRKSSKAIPAHIKMFILGHVHWRLRRPWNEESRGVHCRNEGWRERVFLSVSSLCLVVPFDFHQLIKSSLPEAHGSLSQERRYVY